MIIVDKLLNEIEQPIKVGLVGHGYIGKGIAHQINNYTKGIQLEWIYKRGDDFDSLLKKVDIVVEATGSVEFGCNIAIKSFKAGKHVLVMNSELDATVGPILTKYAKNYNVLYSNCDGDQPGVIMNLYRYVKQLGLRPLVLGNIKSYHNINRNPTDMKEWADNVDQKASMITSFTDGTKINMEMACVGNATGFGIDCLGMNRFKCDDVSEASSLYDLNNLLKSNGIVDYILGAKPAGGVFVIGYTDDVEQQKYLKYYKMGDGPLYTFQQDYHLCHFDVVSSIARMCLLNDTVLTPNVEPILDVVTYAKRDLKKNDTLDGIGGYDCYGVVDTYSNSIKHDYLSMGISYDCKLRNDVPRGDILTYSDVILPNNRLCDTLRKRQNLYHSYF